MQSFPWERTGNAARAGSSMLSCVAAVSADGSSVQLRTALIHGTWITVCSAATPDGESMSTASRAGRRHPTPRPMEPNFGPPLWPEFGCTPHRGRVSTVRVRWYSSCIAGGRSSRLRCSGTGGARSPMSWTRDVSARHVSGVGAGAPSGRGRSADRCGWLRCSRAASWPVARRDPQPSMSRFIEDCTPGPRDLAQMVFPGSPVHGRARGGPRERAPARCSPGSDGADFYDVEAMLGEIPFELIAFSEAQGGRRSDDLAAHGRRHDRNAFVENGSTLVRPAIPRTLGSRHD